LFPGEPKLGSLLWKGINSLLCAQTSQLARVQFGGTAVPGIFCLTMMNTAWHVLPPKMQSFPWDTKCNVYLIVMAVSTTTALQFFLTSVIRELNALKQILIHAQISTVWGQNGCQKSAQRLSVQ